MDKIKSDQSMERLNEIVAEWLNLKKRVKELQSEIYNLVVECHAEHHVGDVIHHCYRGGGNMVIDNVVVDYFDKSESRGYVSFKVSYRGRAINKNGDIGRMMVSNFNSEQPRILINIMNGV